MSPLRFSKLLQTVKFLLVISLCILPFRLSGQSIEKYLKDLESGNREKVEKELPLLIQEYGETPSVLFLRAMLEKDGDLAVAMFKDIALKYPNSDYADDALMKVGEYHYARGLYVQAANYLKRIPIYYSYSPHVEKSILLLITSFEVAGKQDSADFYKQIFSLKYPGLHFQSPGNKPFYLSDRKVPSYSHRSNEDISPERKVTDTTKTSIDRLFSDLEGKIRNILPEKGKEPTGTDTGQTEVKDDSEYKYTIQIGAYGVKQNALNMRARFENLGYDVRIKEIRKGSNTLYGVRIGKYKTIEEARRFGESLKKKHGIDNFYVLRYLRE